MGNDSQRVSIISRFFRDKQTSSLQVFWAAILILQPVFHSKISRKEIISEQEGKCRGHEIQCNWRNYYDFWSVISVSRLLYWDTYFNRLRVIGGLSTLLWKHHTWLAVCVLMEKMGEFSLAGFVRQFLGGFLIRKLSHHQPENWFQFVSFIKLHK